MEAASDNGQMTIVLFNVRMNNVLIEKIIALLR